MQCNCTEGLHFSALYFLCSGQFPRDSSFLWGILFQSGAHEGLGMRLGGRKRGKEGGGEEREEGRHGGREGGREGVRKGDSTCAYVL